MENLISNYESPFLSLLLKFANLFGSFPKHIHYCGKVGFEISLSVSAISASYLASIATSPRVIIPTRVLFSTTGILLIWLEAICLPISSRDTGVTLAVVLTAETQPSYAFGTRIL